MRRLAPVIACAAACASMALWPSSAQAAADHVLRLPEEDRQWLESQHGRLVFGVEKDYPPFTFVDGSGRHLGLAVEYLTSAESAMDIRFVRSEPMSLDELLTGAREGRIHVLTAVKPNPERQKYLHFTRPFVDVPVVLLSAGEPGSRLEDFKDRRIATARGYAVADFLAREHPELRLELFNNDYEALMGVVGGKAAAAVVDLATATHLVRQHGLSALRVVGTVDFSYNLCMASTDERLARILDRALDSIPLDERKRLHEFWFMPAQESRQFRETLPPDEQAWLERHPVLRAVAEPEHGPIECLGTDGVPEGLSVEYVLRLEKMLGVRFEKMSPDAAGGQYRALSEGRADVLASASRAADGRAGIFLTPAYASSPIVLYARTDAPMHVSLDHLEGRALAVVPESAAAELIRRDYPGIRLRPVASADEGLNGLLRREHEFFAETLAVGNYYLAHSGSSAIRVTGGTPYLDDICMGTSDPVLASILTKALASMPTNDRDAMASKWFAVHVERVRDFSLVWKILLGATGVTALFVIWNRQLRREVRLRRLAEEKQTALNERLEAANKELEAFSYSVSHDLRAPLRHVGGFVQLLLKQAESGGDEKTLRYAATIAGATDKMARLIDDLLSFSRLGRTPLRMTDVSLAGIVATCRKELEPEMEGRKIEWDVGELPTIQADPALMRQVFANLLGNAIKYTRNREVARISVSAIRGDGKVVITIRDNGAGFNMAYVNKLFGVFQRLHADAEFEGTGIGLANVRRIIARHGGRVWAEGDVDKGAAFHVALPL